MGLPKFSYIKPKSLKEASSLLVEHGDQARVMAGGNGSFDPFASPGP